MNKRGALNQGWGWLSLSLAIGVGIVVGLAGGSLIAAVDSFYFLPQEVIYHWSATLITGLTLVTWGIFLYRLYKNEVRQIVSRTVML